MSDLPPLPEPHLDVMRPGMDTVIDVLKDMGATNVQFDDTVGADATLQFEFRGKRITLRGVHFNDSTAGIDGCVVFVESVG